MQNDLSESEIIQNLRDAGCGADMIAAFMEAVKNGEPQSGRRLLELYRCSLLADLHTAQKHIDCLDYLLYQMNKRGSLL